MGVMDRARKHLPPTGEYLDKDELVRNQEPMAIANCTYDERAGNSWGPRWVLSIQPWFEEQEGPMGLVTFGANATRNPVFEDIQAQIEENNDEPVGPVVLVKGKSTKGFRFYTLSDWTEAGGASEPAPVEAPAPTPTPARRATRAPQTASVPDPTPPPTPETAKRRPGRPRKATTAETVPVPSISATRPSEAAESPQATTVQLSVGQTVCPDCKQVVTGRVLLNEAGNERYVIHTFCPVLNRATALPVTEEIGAA